MSSRAETIEKAGLDELLGDAFLLGVDVADMQRQYSKELLTTDCGSTK